MSTTIAYFVLSLFVSCIYCLGKTDTITWGGDNSRTGYQTNHNMDPTIVGSPQFGQIFKSALPGMYNGVAEQIFSQPLVYTTSDGIQYIYVATTQNNVYKLDAKTGRIVLKRNLHIPFLAADLDGCIDINPHIGITATGVIDADTDTYYLLAKTYQNQTGGRTAQGKLNGRYYIHAISCNDLSEKLNFPVPIEGTIARNNLQRVFGGGIHHARPGLLHPIGSRYIYGGFASHCVHNNFTGWIIGWDKTSGKLVEHYATEGLGVDSQTKGGGIWMSGGGISSDDVGSLFFATGNGYASQLSTIPVSGHNPPTSLEEAAVHMTINPDGSLTIMDFFMPWEKTQLDGGDRDLGTSPLELLPSEFSCGDIKRVGVVTGKSGKTYWLNLDDLGGYQKGPNKLDKILQVYQNENSVYAGAGVYPGEGGYIYINVIQYPSHVFKFSCTNGVPSFTKVADTPAANAYSGLGVGHGTVTSLNSQPGSGLFWVSDVNGYNLRIYNAVPANGLLTLINQFNIPGVTKFTRPVFGDGRVYIGTTKGFLYGFGAPVNLPFNCSSPYEFGIVDIGLISFVKMVKCTSLLAITVSNITLSGADYRISGLPELPLALARGEAFSFQATFEPTTVGRLSTDVIISVSPVAGYSSTNPVSLQGNGQSVSPLLGISPVTVAFPGLITGQQIGGTNQTLLIINSGNSPLGILQILYSTTSETGPFITPYIAATGAPQVGPYTFFNLPDTIGANSVATVTINFDTAKSGNFAAFINIVSDGGTKTADIVGTAGQAPIALIEFQSVDGLSWIKYVPGQSFTFGNVTENQIRSLRMRITNNATIDSARLSLTISKPPFGSDGLINANNLVDLAEGTTLGPGENASAVVYCSVPKTQWDTDSYVETAHWTVNFNDLTFGKQEIHFLCNAVSEQAQPLLPNGDGQYRYLGCYKENNPGRQLKTQLYGNDNNTNAMCIAACAAGKYAFCGTQYNRECWAGPYIPVLMVDDTFCDFPCKGDINQVCGGNGVGSNQGGSYISIFADSFQYNARGTVLSIASGPVVNPGANGWVSIGCFTESSTGRALPNRKSTTLYTVALCLSACKGFQYAGLEYGGECWCGNNFTTGSILTSVDDCSMTCVDNGTEFCGGSQRLNVYQLSSPFASSKVMSAIFSRTGIPSSSTGYSGTTSSSITDTQLTISRTTTTTVGFLNFNPDGLTSTSGVLDTWVRVGCYTGSTIGRALSSKTYADDSMTLESCGTFCSEYRMFGVEYGRECYCGDVLAAGSVLATQQSDCSSLCPGDGTEVCGAGVRLELYSAMSYSSTTMVSAPLTEISAQATTPPAGYSGPPVINNGNTNFTYYGCVSEPSAGRLFSFQIENNGTAMTIDICLSLCWMYAYAGVEYGRECWCGNAINQIGNDRATPAANVSDNDCSFPCSGNASEFCGAGDRMSLYWYDVGKAEVNLNTTAM